MLHDAGILDAWHKIERKYARRHGARVYTSRRRDGRYTLHIVHRDQHDQHILTLDEIRDQLGRGRLVPQHIDEVHIMHFVEPSTLPTHTQRSDRPQRIPREPSARGVERRFK